MKLELAPIDRTTVARMALGDVSALATASNLAAVGPLVSEVAAAYRDLYRRANPAPPWIGYFAVDAQTKAVVGTCGYNGGCEDGVVEIAYFTFPAFQRRGIAGRMARTLTAMAFREPEVQRVRAHSAPRETASSRLLRGIGFRWFGTFDDPDQGTVWRWEMAREDWTDAA